MNCLQKTARIVSIIAVCALLSCMVITAIAIYRSDNETWFTPCGECKQTGGKGPKCDRCCQDCSWKDAAFYYTFRAFTLAWCIIAIGAEVKADMYTEYLQLCNFYFPRGLWQIFIGLSTVDANVMPQSVPEGKRDTSTETWADVFGWVLCGVGVAHLLMGCCCFKEYSDEGRKRERAEFKPDINPAVGPSQI